VGVWSQAAWTSFQAAGAVELLEIAAAAGAGRLLRLVEDVVVVDPRRVADLDAVVDDEVEGRGGCSRPHLLVTATTASADGLG